MGKKAEYFCCSCGAPMPEQITCGVCNEPTCADCLHYDASVDMDVCEACANDEG